ncbi:TetR/AcrR family transcriptional regulator [Deinococcus pimensis]|uniref:TetR/AcrR family transcriptional regulator n=1 Tax=Deinococcus pimensis TaxID=309888 RepID=UPI0004B24071|nr:TetR/AcrR family transcriptional regulator [Deinococcus pimensis]
MPGRPYNPAHTEAARAAVFDLLEERGYEAISMEAVAERTGISKQALYRRWKHKRALIVDAFAEKADLLPDLPDTGNFERDLRALLRATFALLNGPCGVTNRALVAEALQDPEFLPELRERHLSRRRQQLRTVLERASRRGELKVPPDDTTVDLILGPVWYRLLLQNAPLDTSTADDFTDRLSRLLRGS